MSKAFLLLGRLGDTINALPILHAESQSTGAPVNLICCKQYAPLFGGTSYVNCIPFDGQDSELRRAFDEGKKQFDEVVSLQVIGNTTDVKDISYGPAGFQQAQTDSFQKEPYWLAHRKDLWAKQVRPVFDGRSKARERKLLDSCPQSGERKILVACNGKSSPFAYKPLLIELLIGRFSLFDVVDLDSFKADRFYDFIGLLEQAHCLVCIDSAFLHLAHALPNLPVCALTNDSPNLWFGSTWRANHISHIRYSDFPFRAVEMLDAIDSIGKAASFFCSDVPFKLGHPALIHVWSRYDQTEDSKERCLTARSSWQQNYGTENWIACPIEVGSIGRDSKEHVAIKDETRFPFLRDVIRLASYRAMDDDILVLTRCDTCFTPNLTEQLLNGSLPAYAHRNYREDGQDTWHPMVDLFAFTKKWWDEHKAEVPDFFLAPDQFWNKTLLALFIKLGAREIVEGVYRAPSSARTPQGGKRREHNQHLYSEYQIKHGEIVLFKPVGEQLPSVIVNPQALHQYAYNPSIIRYQNRLLCVYRYHDQRDFSTALAIAEIDEKGIVYGRKQLQIPHMGGSEEDARFFMRGNQLYICYVDSTYPAMPAKAVVKYGRLVEDTVWTVQEIQQPVYGKNDMTGCEKNWVMWEHEGGLMCQYSTSPKTVLLELQGARADVIAEYDGPQWAYGQIRGGTTPLPYKDKLIRFFHSAVDTEVEPDKRRYFVGAMIVEPNPPFKPVAISKRPVLYGSEKDSLTLTQRSTCYHWKSKVVFPLGVIEHADGWLLSCGVNDSQCALVYVTEKDLNL